MISPNDSFATDWLSLCDASYIPKDTGNPLTEWGVAYRLAWRISWKQQERLREVIASKVLPQFLFAPGLFVKKLTNGSYNFDDVTHDDIKGFLSLADDSQKKAFMAECETQAIGPLWFYSSSGQRNWASLIKPADRAAYLLMATTRAPLHLQTCLAAAFLLDSAFNNNASNKRLAWLVAESVEGLCFVVDLAIRFWRFRLNRNGGISAVFANYHGPDHLFTKTALTIEGG